MWRAKQVAEGVALVTHSSSSLNPFPQILVRSHLLVLILKVRVVELAKAGEHPSVELEGSGVGGVVDGGSVEEDGHSPELNIAPNSPLRGMKRTRRGRGG